MQNVYIYDPTADDKLSKVRGIGRYLQTLRENFENEFYFTSDLETIPDHATFINPFFDLLKPPLQIKRRCRKQIAIMHDIIPIKYPDQYPAGVKGNVYKRLNKLALRKYDAVITDSHSSKKDIVNMLGVAEKKVKVVYPILSQHFYTLPPEKPKINLPNTYLLYVGDVTWNKNLTTIAKAIKMAGVTCVFVGKSFHTFSSMNPEEIIHPEQQEIKSFLLEVKKDPRFIFPGYISDAELNYLYKHARANILVSRDEGFGYPFLEAAVFGTPSILSNEPIFQETAQDAALFAETNDPEDIAQQIRKVTKNTTFRNSIGKKAEQRSHFFTAENFKKDFLEGIENNKYYEI